MKLNFLSLALILAYASLASAQIVAKPQVEPKATTSTASADVAKLNAIVGQALQFLSKADNYVLTVQSQWKASGDAPGQEGQSNYRLLARGKQHRIEVQSQGAEAPQLVCVNDGKNVTTLLASQGLYSQHAVGSPQASLESNQMLAQSLAGSAIDILLQPNVGEYVHAQATAVKYFGQEQLGKQKCHRFQLQWAGAEVELWFAAAGDPLLVQFVRTACVPTSETECYEMVHTARFQWKLNTQLPTGAFAVELPANARRVNDIYDALSGDDPAARIGQPLPKIKLSQLDGTTINVAVPEGKRGLVMIFWATWCTPSVEQMPAVSEFVKAGAAQGFAFYAVNVGALPESLLEAELFGHEKGAFTGAISTRPGLVEVADGGTLFLDEVVEMPPPLQAKLLRMTEDRTLYRVGGRQRIHVDIRIVAATNRDLVKEIAEGRVRQDLYYRLAGVEIAVPPLRDRPEDVEPLARHYLALAARRAGRGPTSIAAPALGALVAYRWPGNVRELRNLMERCAWTVHAPVLEIQHLPLEVVVTPGSRSGPLASDMRERSLKDMERDRIQEVLDQESWHHGHAATRLGMPVRTLYRKIKAYHLARPAKSASL